MHVYLTKCNSDPWDIYEQGNLITALRLIVKSIQHTGSDPNISTLSTQLSETQQSFSLKCVQITLGPVYDSET